MTINTDLFVPITDTAQDFSKIARLVEDEGMAIILKNDRPKYIVVDFDEYNEIKSIRERMIEKSANDILLKNMEAFKELAK